MRAYSQVRSQPWQIRILAAVSVVFCTFQGWRVLFSVNRVNFRCADPGETPGI